MDAPPTYGTIDGSPPSYVRASSHYTTEHIFQLKNMRDKAWASLKVRSGAKSSTDPPLFVEGDAISGTLELTLSKDHVEKVTISVIGTTVRNVYDGSAGPISLTQGVTDDDMTDFVCQSQTVWPVASSGTTSSATKLDGEYSWPYSIKLPKEVTIAPTSDPKFPHGTFKLPPSFRPRNTRFSVVYNVQAVVHRGRFRSDYQLKMPITYFPIVKPEAASPLRQIAYQENDAIPGPDKDPEGWRTLPMLTICGRVFDNREVHIKCTLSLAKPLCYPRGTAIPCSIILESTDEQALDMLSSPQAIVVRLQRRIMQNAPAARAQTYEAGLNLDSVIDYPGTAKWWAVSDGGQHRRLDGEIRLPHGLQSSAAMLLFAIQYHVMIFPFEASGFKPASGAPVLSESVEIANQLAPGPKPIVYSLRNADGPLKKVEVGEFKIGDFDPALINSL